MNKTGTRERTPTPVGMVAVASACALLTLLALPSIGLGQSENPKPHPADLFKAPAAKGETRACAADASMKTQPPDLQKTQPQTDIVMSFMRRWAMNHFTFKGPANCTDGEFIVEQWQATFGLPVTGVVNAAVIDSVLAEQGRTRGQYQLAFEEWKQNLRASGKEYTIGGTPPGPTLAQTKASAPMEKQAFGLYLGVSLATQLPVCPRLEGWGSGRLSAPQTCYVSVKRLGVRSDNYSLSLEAETLEKASRVMNVGEQPPLNGRVVIVFPREDRPGLLDQFSDGIEGVLVGGRLEGIGFVPSSKKALIDAFSGRFGAPEQRLGEMSNSGGGKWTGERYSFRRGEVTAMVNCLKFDGTCSYAQVLTAAGEAGLNASERADTDQGVKF